VCQFGVSGNWKMPWDTPLTTRSPGRQPCGVGFGSPPHLVSPLGSPAKYHHVTLYVPSAGAMTPLNCKESGLPCPRMPPTSPPPEQIAHVRRLASPVSVLPGASASYVVPPPVPAVSVTLNVCVAKESLPVTVLVTVPLSVVLVVTLSTALPPAGTEAGVSVALLTLADSAIASGLPDTTAVWTEYVAVCPGVTDWLAGLTVREKLLPTVAVGTTATVYCRTFSVLADACGPNATVPAAKRLRSN